MRLGSFSLFGIMAGCAACSGTPDDPSGSGASGGSGGGGASGGSSTTSTTATGATGGGGTGGTGGCSAPAANVYDNAAETGIPACDHGVAPLSNEDGTFSVTLFGPFAEAFQLTGFSFGALESQTTAPTDPWTAAVVVVPAGSDPLLVNPSESAKPYPLMLLEELPADSGTARRFSIQLDAPLAVGVCDTVVVALRNTVGPPLSGLLMCGSGSDHPETNQWWNLDDTMTEMSTYGSNFDRDWWVSLLPAAD